MPLPSYRAAALAGLLSSLAVAAPAAGAELPSGPQSVTIDDAKRQFCATRSVTGAGVERRAYTAPADGVLAARLSGSDSSDWDLAVLDRDNDQVINGSAGPGSDELATAIVSKGQAVTVQLCRRSGASSTASLRLAFTAVVADRAQTDAKIRLVRVTTKSRFDAYRLSQLGLDTTDHPHPDHWDVMLYSDADERKLRQAGFTFVTREDDVVASDRANRLRERRARSSRRARAAASVGIPSGRTSYRTLPEHEEELKRLAQENPGLVRLIALPLTSWEGRQILGVEIAENVTSTTDGRPAYVQVGTHHAREWPANEATLEWGLELVKGYKEGDPRLTSIVKDARTYIIPVLNVDGFDATIQSEGLAPGGNYVDPQNSGTVSGSQGIGTGAYKRKNCRPLDASQPVVPGACLARTFPATTANRDLGVDPNRNYGVEWGGPGTSSRVQSLVYHGPGPFSEPETEGFRRFLRDIQPSVLITNHTFTGLILRPPGTSTFGPVPDEERLRALGDAMARETDYVSQFSYQLYDTTGTTDDYLYDGLGAFSYTPEIGKVEFHPAYSEFIAEYDGRPETDINGAPTGRKLGGLREAYTLAGATAINADSHSIIQGTAPAGRTLRITKSISYTTSERPNDDGVQNPVQTVTEPRNSTTVVPAGGRFVWHVNPSRQPRVAAAAAWRLTCEDGAGNVLESRNIYVERAQSVNVGLTCGAASSPTQPQPTQPPAGSGGSNAGTCVAPNGFRSVDVRQRGRGLLFSFSRTVRNPVTVELFQTATRTRVIGTRRVARFTNRQRSFRWAGLGPRGRRLSDGVYYARFRMRDAQGRLDTRRVTAERRNGRFTKARGYYLIDTCA